MRRWVAIVAPTVFVGLLLAIWEGACRAMAVPEYFLPTPSAIVVALAENAPLLFVSAWRTLSTALLAFGVVSALAGVAALGAAAGRIVEDSFRPIAVVLQVTPIISLAPLFQIWAGIDHPGRAVVALACVAAFFPIYSGALAGLRAPDPALERLFDLYGATGWQRLTRLRVPSAVPQALEGLKVGLGLALVGTVIGEISAGAGGQEGLAWRILEASHRLETAKSFAALTALALMAGVLHLIFQLIERRSLAWWRGW
ncbi:MAG TPA: ABC transporter permease subunit [Caulobacteraceae bacterium]